MKKIALGLIIMAASALIALGGESYSGKEAKEVVPPPCPEWYGDTEWNVGIWGAYAFTSENWQDDRYLEADHAWGGGIDLKYFFNRYFGVGVEGFGLKANRRSLDLFEDESSVLEPEPLRETGRGSRHSRLTGAVLGTLTFRYPFHCSRFAPYIFGGAGAIFGGGERATFIDDDPPIGTIGADNDRTVISDSDTRFIGQVGGGVEVRFTPHIGWLNDFSWNFVGRNHSDFGMARSGINFAF
jgi:Outer membrane protein beta-barrel domain